MWVTKTAKGGLVRETEYRNDQKNGIEKEYFPNGSVKSIFHYTNGTKNGNCILFNKEGDTSVVCNYLDNMLHGEYFENFQSYYKNGTIKGTYNLGKREGLWVENMRRNQKEVELDSTWYSKEKRNGRSVQYINGKLFSSSNYVQGWEEGEQRTYYLKNPEQIQFIANYKAGSKHGTSYSYYESGNIMSVLHYKQGRSIGCDTTWFDKERSIMNTICYTENSFAKVSHEYWENGNLKLRVHYASKPWTTDSSFAYNENGQLVQEWRSNKGGGVRSTEYYPNGKVKAKGDYISDSKYGLWVYYDSTGKKTKEKLCTRFSKLRTLSNHWRVFFPCCHMHKLNRAEFHIGTWLYNALFHSDNNLHTIRDSG